VACTITFMSAAGEHPLAMHVEQSAAEVEVRIREGQPFRVNETSTGMPVHVNPAAIAFWKDQPAPASA